MQQLELKDNKRQLQELADAKDRFQSGQITLSQTELSDISRLDTRRGKSIGTRKYDLKHSGIDTVLLKRIEAEKATKIFDSRTVQNSNFDLGLPHTATQADRDFMIRQSQEHRERLQKIQQNKIDPSIQITQGKIIQNQIGSTTKEQKEKLKLSGINLNTGALSSRALARLRAKGLI